MLFREAKREMLSVVCGLVWRCLADFGDSKTAVEFVFRGMPIPSLKVSSVKIDR